GFRDSRRPGPRLLVGHQRHGSNFREAMTALTMTLEQGEDVFIKSRSWFVGSGGCDSCNQNRRGERSHAEENAHINSVQERNCHPERSGCFALRSSRAVEGPYPRKKLSPWKLPSQVSNCGKIEIPRLHPPIRNANGRITLRMTLNLSGGQKTTPAVFRPEIPAP